MVTDNLAAEIAEHWATEASEPFCLACFDAWPCLVRRLADDRDRLRAAEAVCQALVERQGSPPYPTIAVVKARLAAWKALAPSSEPDAGGERR